MVEGSDGGEGWWWEESAYFPIAIKLKFFSDFMMIRKKNAKLFL
jgi:hypothetical protein